MEPVLATTRAFEVCGSCCELRGPFVWRWKGVDYEHVQECACERNRRADGERPETWLAFDYNTVAELCQACGCQVLPSGSRYSVWFCGECKERVRALNAEVGQPLVPIGRHTLMNGFGLQTTPKPTDAEIGVFVARFGTVVKRIDRLREWGHEVVRDNLVTIGREHTASMPLTEYLEAVSRIDGGERFDAMVESMTLRRDL